MPGVNFFLKPELLRKIAKLTRIDFRRYFTRPQALNHNTGVKNVSFVVNQNSAVKTDSRGDISPRPLGRFNIHYIYPVLVKNVLIAVRDIEVFLPFSLPAKNSEQTEGALALHQMQNKLR